MGSKYREYVFEYRGPGDRGRLTRINGFIRIKPDLSQLPHAQPNCQTHDEDHGYEAANCCSIPTSFADKIAVGNGDTTSYPVTQIRKIY